jgi:hypothetical protein
MINPLTFIVAEAAAALVDFLPIILGEMINPAFPPMGDGRYFASRVSAVAPLTTVTLTVASSGHERKLLFSAVPRFPVCVVSAA